MKPVWALARPYRRQLAGAFVLVVVYAATVLAPSFSGKSRVQQHQLVYQALKGHMGGVLHALALQTAAPERPAWRPDAYRSQCR